MGRLDRDGSGGGSTLIAYIELVRMLLNLFGIL